MVATSTTNLPSNDIVHAIDDAVVAVDRPEGEKRKATVAEKSLEELRDMFRKYNGFIKIRQKDFEFQVSFPFDKELNSEICKIPGAHFDKGRKFWRIKFIGWDKLYMLAPRLQELWDDHHSAAFTEHLLLANGDIRLMVKVDAEVPKEVGVVFAFENRRYQLTHVSKPFDRHLGPCVYLYGRSEDDEKEPDMFEDPVDQDGHEDAVRDEVESVVDDDPEEPDF